MSDEMNIAKDRISRELPEAELLVDQALASVSELMNTIVQARIDTGVPAATAQLAIRRLAKAQSALVDVSTDVLRAHDELKKVGREHAGWDTEECPPAQARKEAKPVLSIVA